MNEKQISKYIELAREISTLSPDAETKVGAVMLNSNEIVIAGAFNGFVVGSRSEDLPTTRPDKYEFILHAERNMLYKCSREGIKTKNSTVVCTLSPCLECIRAMFQSGVKTVAYEITYPGCSSLGYYENLADIVIIKKTVGKYTVLEMSNVDRSI